MAKNFAKAGAGMVAVGAVIIGGMAKLVNSYSQAGDEVAKMARRTGISTEALSEMRHVADITGTSLTDFEKGIKKMSKSLVDADAGLETYIRSFDRIGLSVEDLMAMKPEEQFFTIAEAIGQLANDTEQAATAQEIFGRAGTMLIPMMEETGESIAFLRQEAHELNIVFDAEAAAAAESFEDSKTRLKGALTGIGNTIAEAVMPQFEEFVQMLTEKLKPAMEWLKEHPEVVQAFLKFGVAFAATGAIFLAIAGFIKLINFALIPAIVRATIAFIAMLAAAGPWGWAAIAAGAGIAATAIVALQKMLGGLGISGAGGVTAPAPREATPMHWMPAESEAILPPGHHWEYAGNSKRAVPNASFQFGGIVPGPIGQPVPIMAHGGEQFAGVGNTLGNTININVAGSLWRTSDLVRDLRREFKLAADRNVDIGF